jgi:hypothetical protein
VLEYVLTVARTRRKATATTVRSEDSHLPSIERSALPNAALIVEIDPLAGELSFATNAARCGVVEWHGLGRVSRLHTYLYALVIAIAEKESVRSIILDRPSVRFALYYGLAHGSVKICADQQMGTYKDVA